MYILLFYLPLLFLALYTITLHFLHKIFNLPPTPFPTLPFIGHIYLLLSKTKPLHRALSDVSRRHGPIVFLKLGSRPVLLVSSPSAAQECFTRNDVVFANRPECLKGKHFGYNFTSLLWASYGDRWRKLRRIVVSELLSSRKVHVLSKVRGDQARKLIQKLLRDSKSNKAVDVKPLLFEYAYHVAKRMITGKDEIKNSKEAEEFQEILEQISMVTLEANVIDVLPFMRWFGGFKDVERKMILIQKKREQFMKNVIEEHRRLEDTVGGGCGGKKKSSLLQVLLDLEKEESEFYTDETIRNLLLVLIQGASLTTSNTLESALSLLLENPDVLKRARAEIDNCVGKDRLITESDVAESPYLQCIIKETMRIYPAAPLLTPHVSSDKCTVGRYHIPRGTILLVNAWDIHSNVKTWEDPEKFMPERFEGAKNQDFKFIPFGWGRRACPGENLGMNMVGLALGSLIQCFEWEKVGEIDISEGKGIITAQVQPLSATCIPRSFVVNLIS